MKYVKTIILGSVSAILLIYLNLVYPESILPLVDNTGTPVDIIPLWLYHIAKVLFLISLGYDLKKDRIVSERVYIPYDETDEQLYPQIKKIDEYAKLFKDQE